MVSEVVQMELMEAVEAQLHGFILGLASELGLNNDAMEIDERSD